MPALWSTDPRGAASRSGPPEAVVLHGVPAGGLGGEACRGGGCDRDDLRHRAHLARRPRPCRARVADRVSQRAAAPAGDGGRGHPGRSQVEQRRSRAGTSSSSLAAAVPAVVRRLRPTKLVAECKRCVAHRGSENRGGVRGVSRHCAEGGGPARDDASGRAQYRVTVCRRGRDSSSSWCTHSWAGERRPGCRGSG